MLTDHRALMLSAESEKGRIRQFRFMGLPEDLQSELIDLIDRREVSFRQAAQFSADHGFSINRESVRSYYKALTMERRTYELKCSMGSAVRAFEDVPTAQSLQALLHVLASALARSFTESSVPLKDVDVSKLISVLITATATKKGEGERKEDKTPD
jgi:hypothetical protein